MSPQLSRRDFLRLLVLPPAAFLAACTSRTLETVLPTLTAPASDPAAAPIAQLLPPTPACGDDDDDPTPPQTAGPFYTPNTPERTSLREAGLPGTLLTVTGQVRATDCAPIAGALLDFWHCDDAGNYDNVGYTYRGHQYADADGRYLLETILPGVYPGRTRHIHVRVQAPNQPALTTQLYFSGEPGNARDGIYNPVLEMALTDGADGKLGTFDFILTV